MTLVEQTEVLLRLRHAETYGAALAVLTGLYWGYGLWRMRRRSDGGREWGGPRPGRPAVRALFSGACLALALGCLHLGARATEARFDRAADRLEVRTTSALGLVVRADAWALRELADVRVRPVKKKATPDRWAVELVRGDGVRMDLADERHGTPDAARAEAERIRAFLGPQGPKRDLAREAH